MTKILCYKIKRFAIRHCIVPGFALLVLFPLYANPLKLKPQSKPGFKIEIRDHKFVPAEIIVPVNQKIKLIVKNSDATAEEFESYDFNREKIVPGNSEITIFVGPLKPGTYHFFGEFNPDTAQGTIRVNEEKNSTKKGATP